MAADQATYQVTQTIMFYLFAAIALLLSLRVVTTRRLLRAAVYLVVVLVSTAAFYLMLGAEFLAGVQVLVYVGGIVVLIVFAIMLTSKNDLLEDVPSMKRKLLGALGSFIFFAVSTLAFTFTDFHIYQKSNEAFSTKEIGLRLLDYGPAGYVVPFELISLLLLAAVIGGIVIARKSDPPDIDGSSSKSGKGGENG